MQRTLLFVCFVLLALNWHCQGAPIPADQKDSVPQEAKSAFGIAFDEIVVESSLTVVPRKNNARQAKAKPVNLAGNGKAA